jgi:aspartyl-tRNA(Asn)/glutamyl-tRNA(Gln) amidotransferase subunit A
MSIAESVATSLFREAVAALRNQELPDPAMPSPLTLDVMRWERVEPYAGSPAPPDFSPATAPGPSFRLPPALTSAPTLVDAATALRAGKLTARALVEQALSAMPSVSHLGAVVAVDEIEAFRQADRLDAERRAGHSLGPLHGIPFTVKDVIDVAGLPTRAGSIAYEGLPIADAASVVRLRDAGAVILAKVATHEFALGVATPQCRNPYDQSRLSGGSSGGSAIAVATGIGLASLGTDTRASLRVPAALCGVVAFKPTFGRVPTEGVVPLSWSVDHVGPIARTVEDAAAVLAVLTGDPAIAFDKADSARDLVVGVVPALLDGTEPEVVTAFEQSLYALERLGCRLVTLERPDPADMELANALGLIATRCEAAAFHRANETELELCIPEVRDQLGVALELRAVDYIDAQRQRHLLAVRILDLFGSCDLVATPTTPIVAPPREDYERYLFQLSQNTILWSLLGAPAISLPCGTSAGGLPIGLQLAAAPGAERTLTRAGVLLERAMRG